MDLRKRSLLALQRRFAGKKDRAFWQRAERMLRPALLGTLRRTSPLSDSYGFDRGLPIDRYYIEAFLSQHSPDIHGRVLEVKDNRYTKRFGRGVTRHDVLDVDAANARATIVADLSAADTVPDGIFDCFVLVQTLQFIYDVPAALRHAHRMLATGGVLLATVPALSRVDRELERRDFWRFTAASCQRLWQEAFGPDNVSVHSYGNVLTGIGFLAGMACEELSRRELDATDEYFPLIIAVRAVKSEPLR
jgi:SAM-dependent methyltransferase